MEFSLKTSRHTESAFAQIRAAEYICSKCRGGGTIRKNAYHAIICPACKGTGLSGKAKKPHKYNVVSKDKRTYKGIVYHSQLEAHVAAWLNLRTKPSIKCWKCKGAGSYTEKSVWDEKRNAWVLRTKASKEGSASHCTMCRGTGNTGGDILRWEQQVPFDLYAWDYSIDVTRRAPKKKVGTYTIDFRIEFTNGTIEYWEVKAWKVGKKLKRGGRGKGGPYFHPGDKLRIAIWQANNPDKALRIITGEDLPKGV